MIEMRVSYFAVVSGIGDMTFTHLNGAETPGRIEGGFDAGIVLRWFLVAFWRFRNRYSGS